MITRVEGLGFANKGPATATVMWSVLVSKAKKCIAKKP